MESPTIITDDSDSRILALEEQVKMLSDELTQCQADKEFVWSLWKRLQVANPDLTQAVSLVVEREKHKAEMKDRKVLEILQSKDFRIQELEQKVAVQQQELSSSVHRGLTEEESAVMKNQVTALQEQLEARSLELTEMKSECKRQREEDQRVVQALEEKKEGLEARCAALRSDLEERERQICAQREQRDTAQERVKELEAELHRTWQELSTVQSHSGGLAAQLSAKDRELMTKEEQLSQLRKECAEVQALYRQSAEHAADQSLLIRQLEGLNLDTQRVMRNQEEAHNADATSYQKLYTELSQSYQALVSSEAQLRQSLQELRDQLAQKDQQLHQLQSQILQQLQQTQTPPPQLPSQKTPLTGPSPNRQTNFKAALSESALRRSSSSEQVSAHEFDPGAEERTLRHQSSRSVTRHKRSRSLSPGGSVELRGARREDPEERIQALEELLQLKTEENEELRKAHENRRERLRLIQSNYRTIRDQLKDLEKASGIGRKIQRAEPWQLRQEDSDAVWNELAYLKNLTRKLSLEKAGVEEELDMLRVQAAMDRATVKEVQLRLVSEHKELLHKVVKERQVKSSTPKKPSVSLERLEESFKKIELLEQRMESLEEETERLREEKDHLQEANEELAHKCSRLQASLDQRQAQDGARSEAAQAQALLQAERHRSEILAVETRLASSQKEAARLHHRLLKLRQELGILRAARDFYRNRATMPTRATGSANNINSKVKFKTSRLRGPTHLHSHPRAGPNQAISWLRRSPSPSKDEWEDMSADSDSGDEYTDSLNSVTRGEFRRRRAHRKSYRPAQISKTKEPPVNSSRNPLLNQDDEQCESWDRGGENRRWRRQKKKTQACPSSSSSSSSSLRQRVESLQRHHGRMRKARDEALVSARELRAAKEKITEQVNSLTDRLSSSRQIIQKLTSDLAGVEQQKKVLEMELAQWRQVSLPPKPAPAAPVLPACFCQGRPCPPDPALPALEAEVKLLQVKLKSSGSEVTKQVAANKALRGQLQEKEDKLRQLQDKAAHVERDVNMKRQLVEDLKTRLKFLQDMEGSYRGQVEELEKKVKTLTEEATNRKAFIESLKRRLNVATTEKSQYEASCAKLKEELEKKEQRVCALQARVGAGEQALSALQKTATEQMEGLTQQSSQALDRLQRQLAQALAQLEQLHAFIKALASEILLDVGEVKQQLMKKKRRRQRQSSAMATRSMIKAKTIAASILNMSENDLADIMDSDQEAAACPVCPGDQQWMDHLNHILQQKWLRVIS
ncbi:centlein isoform X2 [Boleophthalmus pectinirostris]|uniref:centlein isoform X2 n=1 Tax=Boleophthalmus pectinirostris TaxID=150288 RepID=UPI00242E2647|nr:centlein isoform X2 [Boleophthalmus pectinirostris]